MLVTLSFLHVEKSRSEEEAFFSIFREIKNCIKPEVLENTCGCWLARSNDLGRAGSHSLGGVRRHQWEGRAAGGAVCCFLHVVVCRYLYDHLVKWDLPQVCKLQLARDRALAP